MVMYKIYEGGGEGVQKSYTRKLPIFTEDYSQRMSKFVYNWHLVVDFFQKGKRVWVGVYMGQRKYHFVTSFMDRR